MTDNEIIKALKDCTSCEVCTECDSKGVCDGLCELLYQASDLINRQQAEIERLQKAPKCLYEYDGEAIEYCVQSPCYNYKGAEEVRTATSKEFAERLKHNLEVLPIIEFTFNHVMLEIDNLLKEMEKNDE